jgi:hypothetical protein
VADIVRYESLTDELRSEVDELVAGIAKATGFTEAECRLVFLQKMNEALEERLEAFAKEIMEGTGTGPEPTGLLGLRACGNRHPMRSYTCTRPAGHKGKHRMRPDPNRGASITW